MASGTIPLMAGYRRATGRNFAKFGHRACDDDWWDDEYWSEPLTVGYAESWGPLPAEDVPDDPEPERAPIGFVY